MRAGVKPANRVTLPPDQTADLEARARREGFAVARGAELAAFPGRPPAAVVYISPDAQRARELADAEAPLLSSDGRGLPVDYAVPIHARIGRLLGFPSCCIAEFCTRLRRDVTLRLDGRRAHEDFVAAEYAARASQRFLGRLDDLSPDRRLRIVTFYPCRYDCPAAADYAAAVFAHAERADPAAAVALRAALLGAMSIAVDGRRGPAASLDGEVLTVEFSDF
jgi:hypothetical protein